LAALQVLAEPRRTAILELLRDGERPVSELVELLQLSQPAVSKHLRVLRDAGLVEARVDAQRRLYRRRRALSARVRAATRSLVSGGSHRPGGMLLRDTMIARATATATAARIWPARARYTAPAMATAWPTGKAGAWLYPASEGPYHALLPGNGLGRMVIGSGDRIRSRCASR
jgi:DNA-binding transcriptional ArsR family regulator